MMFQDFALFPHMTVAKQVGFGLEMLKKPKAEIAQRVQHILKSFEIAALADRKPGQPVRRPAPARGAGARHDHRAAHPAARRADRRARLFAARDGDARAEAAAAAHRHLLHLGDARPERGLLAGRPRRGHEPRAHRAAGPAGGDPAAAGDRLRRGLRAGQQRLSRPRAGAAGRHAPRSRRRSARFLVPRALPPRRRCWAARCPSRCVPSRSPTRCRNATSIACRRACTAVEYFGAVRRHIFERSDGEVLKYDQFGAHAARIVPGQTAMLGWPAEDDGAAYRGGPDEHHPRPLARQLLAGRSGGGLDAGRRGGADRAAGLGVVLGRPRLLDGQPAHLRQLRQVLRQPDLPQARAAATVVAHRDADGRHRRAGLLHRLLPGDEGQEPGLAAGAVPGLRRSVLDQHPDPRHRLGAVPRRQRRDQPGPDVRRRHALADRGVPLFAHRHHHGAGVALHHDGGRAGRLHAERRRAAAARGGDDAQGARPSSCSGASSFR